MGAGTREASAQVQSGCPGVPQRGGRGDRESMATCSAERTAEGCQWHWEEASCSRPGEGAVREGGLAPPPSQQPGCSPLGDPQPGPRNNRSQILTHRSWRNNQFQPAGFWDNLFTRPPIPNPWDPGPHEPSAHLSLLSQGSPRSTLGGPSCALALLSCPPSFLLSAPVHLLQASDGQFDPVGHGSGSASPRGHGAWVPISPSRASYQRPLNP